MAHDMAYYLPLPYNKDAKAALSEQVHMELPFDRGNPQQPKGHALAYFRVSTEPDKVYSTYVVILPVKADLAKYVPPFLASHLSNMSLSDFSAFAMPPVPEVVSSYQELRRLSDLRDDDLVYGGSMFSFDLPRMMESVSELVQVYSNLCAEYFRTATSPETPAGGAAEGADEQSYQVNEVLFSLMSEGDRLAELARFLGKLRFALEGQDSGMLDEAIEEINTLARHLPESFQVPSLLAAARDASHKGSRLAQLYLDRCFRLSAGDLASVQSLEEQIRSLQAQEK